MRNYLRYGLWVAFWDGSEYVVRRKINYKRDWEPGNVEEWDRYRDGDEAEEVARTLNDYC